MKDKIKILIYWLLDIAIIVAVYSALCWLTGEAETVEGLALMAAFLALLGVWELKVKTK